jgi:hypothetical protein
MNSPRTGLRVASVIFAIFALGHLLRLINHAQVTVGTLTIPMGVSWIALIVAAILCVWLSTSFDYVKSLNRKSDLTP